MTWSAYRVIQFISCHCQSHDGHSGGLTTIGSVQAMRSGDEDPDSHPRFAAGTDVVNSKRSTQRRDTRGVLKEGQASRGSDKMKWLSSRSAVSS